MHGSNEISDFKGHRSNDRLDIACIGIKSKLKPNYIHAKTTMLINYCGLFKMRSILPVYYEISTTGSHDTICL